MAESSVSPGAKGAHRKALIIDAALTIVGRDGLGQLSMRSLAAEAGVPLGAIGYYFENKRALILETFDAHSRRELERVIGAIASMGRAASPQKLAEVLIDFVLDGLRNTQWRLVAEYEYLLEASRMPELARASTLWQQSLRIAVADAVERLGSHHPGADAQVILAVLVGLEVENLTGKPPSGAQRTDIERTIRHAIDGASAAWSGPAAGDSRGDAAADG